MRTAACLGAALGLTACGSTAVQTVTKTVVETVASPSTPAATQTTASGPSKTFSGDGTKNLGDITVDADSTLSWTCSGILFQILDPQEGLIVNSQAHSGTSAVTAGTYHHVLVNALGHWTIRISPG